MHNAIKDLMLNKLIHTKIPRPVLDQFVHNLGINLKDYFNIGLDIKISGFYDYIILYKNNKPKFVNKIDKNKENSISVKQELITNNKYIRVNVPFYNKHHPEKLRATKFDMFNVYEYTKTKEHTTEEIDFNLLEIKIKEAIQYFIEND